VAPAREFTRAGATLVAEGHREGEPVYVLVHGIGMGRTVFGDLRDRLGADAAVVALDLPGYGEAPEPPRVLTIERTADLVGAYLREVIRRPAILVGHSMGAQIAIEVAVRHPATLARLVLIGPSGDPTARSGAAQFGRLARDLIIESPRVIAVGAREYLRAGPNLRGKFRALLAHRPEDVLADVSSPTLVLRGEDDVVAPRSWCRRIVDAVPDARLAEVAGHGHETMIRDAGPAAALIREFAAEG
jgi:pimeloyl-ACP methyl ester carboxylesterase